MSENSKSPFFSIVTVCWNDKDGLMQTQRSLREQVCRDFEWIIVDGNSKDGTKLFLEQLPLSECQYWVSELDEGLYDAMNKGLTKAKGEYVTFLNSGDTLANQSVLELLKEEIRTNDFPKLVYGDAYEQVGNGEKLLKKARDESWIWYGMFTHHQSILYKRNAIDKLHYRLEYKLAADYAFTSEFIRANPSSIYYVPMGVCIFEGGGLTSTWKAHVLGMKEQWKIGRVIQGKGMVFSFATLVLHLLKHAVIRITPKLVRAIRYKKGDE